MQRSAPAGDIHDSPTGRVILAAGRQAQRARRAEAVRQKQRAALLALLAQTMAELNISMAELGAARRALADSLRAKAGGLGTGADADASE
ncbi:hypothetical protein [Variovorax paradoxus]|uniref:Uncharacterized protein n=1 Tax=Variovorax paradoxus TaxID=34073 RepID=A0A679JBW4_VARPD|nr:hypothetical protein VVAX_06729 [Variovorax paradoxus]